MTQAQLAVFFMLTLSLLASATDLRTGLIPNWLTCPALLVGPGIAAAYSGGAGLMLSLLGILIAGAVAVPVYRLGGLGGGDVKLFAALAGLGGPRLGLEVELGVSCCLLLWCVATLRGSASRPVRLGGAIFTGTLIALAKELY